MNYSRVFLIRAAGRMLARIAMLTMLSVSLILSLAALSASAPETAREFGEAVTIVDLGATQLTAFGPLFAVLLVWAVAPLYPVIKRLVVKTSRDLGVTDA